jgi:APA family basic amino acid/polyamine antiporter
LLGLIVLCLFLGWQTSTVQANFFDFWTPRDLKNVAGDLNASTVFGLIVALCVVQTGSLFSADAWNNITFAAGEVRNPRRTIPLALGLGSGTVILLYLLANLGYLATLPLEEIQNASEDRVGTQALAVVLPGLGVTLMAAAIMISTFGCNNGLILAGARVYYAMARDKLFFQPAGRLNRARVPGWGLLLQGTWAAALVLPRVLNPKEGKYGNLYSDLLEYVISAALLFYIMTIAGIFRLRFTRPNAERPYRAVGYPIVPALYIAGAGLILVMLFVYRPLTTWPGLGIVLLGVPVYWTWKWWNNRHPYP